MVCMLVAEAHTPTQMHAHAPNGCGMMEEGQYSYNDSRISVITGDTDSDALACCGELRAMAANTGPLVYRYIITHIAIFICNILLLCTCAATFFKCCVCKCTFMFPCTYI